MTAAHDGAISQTSQRLRPLKRRYEGVVVLNTDPKGLGRVKVEIPALTRGLKVDALPWYRVWQPNTLGSSPYTGHFGVPQVNTQVYVEFLNEDIYSGEVIGGPVNRTTLPNDQLNLAADYIIPPSSEHHFTQDWTKVDDTTPGQKHFSPNLVDDEQSYPFVHGIVTNSLSWIKENLLLRTWEVVLSNFLKFKTFANGNTVLHIPGHLKIVIEKDLYLEVRGSTDLVHMSSVYRHIIGNDVKMVEHMSTVTAKRGIKVNGKNIVLS